MIQVSLVQKVHCMKDKNICSVMIKPLVLETG